MVPSPRGRVGALRRQLEKARVLSRSRIGRARLWRSVLSRTHRARPPSQVLDEATTPRNIATLEAVRVVVTLGVPDLVGTGDAAVAGLAASAGADPDALSRVLRHLVERGLFSEPSPGHVSLTEAGALLRSDHPDSRAATFRLGVQYFDAALRELLYSVRTGRPSFERANGAPPWKLMAETPQLAASFDEQMRARAHAVGPELLGAYDWSGVTRVADVGGGNGHLLRILLLELEGTQGTLVEYAAAAARARSAVGADPEVAQRCTVVESDFFVSVPAGADAYLLGSVLHDWPDDKAVQILRNCATAAEPLGRVLVLEKPLDVAPDTELDLRMLVLYGGRERTRAEYETLARRGGLAVRSWTVLPCGFAVMDARPAPGPS